MAEEKKQRKTMFYGEHDRTLDPQCRISLPCEWRSRDEDSELVMLPAPGNALILLPGDTLHDFFEKLQDESIANPEIQMAFAFLGSRARVCRCDKQGRLPLDRKKLEAVGITGQVKLIGALTHIRICAPENWQVPQDETVLAGYLGNIRNAGKGAADGLAAVLSSVLSKR